MFSSLIIIIIIIIIIIKTEGRYFRATHAKHQWPLLVQGTNSPNTTLTLKINGFHKAPNVSISQANIAQVLT